MNTITNNSTTPGVHRGIWIGGGLMALTIVALATTLVIKGNHADAPSADPLATAAATSAASSAPMDTTQLAQGQAPATTTSIAAPEPVPAHGTHHTPGHHDTRGVGSDGASGGPNYANESTSGAPQQVASVAACATCGVIDSYSAVTVQGQNNGVGAVAGGVGGALIGSKIAGRGNHTLGGIIGAVGGGLLGNAVETHQRKSTAYDVRVRMNDGSVRTVRQSTVPTVGTHVRIDGNALVADTSQG